MILVATLTVGATVSIAQAAKKTNYGLPKGPSQLYLYVNKKKIKYHLSETENVAVSLGDKDNFSFKGDFPQIGGYQVISDNVNPYASWTIHSINKETPDVDNDGDFKYLLKPNSYGTLKIIPISISKSKQKIAKMAFNDFTDFISQVNGSSATSDDLPDSIDKWSNLNGDETDKVQYKINKFYFDPVDSNAMIEFSSVNGVNTSLTIKIQVKMLQTMKSDSKTYVYSPELNYQLVDGKWKLKSVSGSLGDSKLPDTTSKSVVKTVK